MASPGVSIIAGRRLERREQPRVAAQAGRADHPNQKEFGEPDYTDDIGRQYRVAHLDRLSGWAPGAVIPPHTPRTAATGSAQVRMWVRLRRGHTNDWWNNAERPARITLKPLKAHLAPLTIDIESAYRDRPTRQTGVIVAKVAPRE
jgi:hypothetical protein